MSNQAPPPPPQVGQQPYYPYPYPYPQQPLPPNYNQQPPPFYYAPPPPTTPPSVMSDMYTRTTMEDGNVDDGEESEGEDGNKKGGRSIQDLFPGAKKGDSQVLQYFLLYHRSLLQSVGDAFDDDPKLQNFISIFDMTVIRGGKVAQEQYCKKYHKQMSPYYEACREKNPKPFLEEKIHILKEIDFKNKYLEITDESVYDEETIKANTENLWEYIIETNKYAALFNQLSQKMLGKIEGKAMEIVDDLKSGRTSLTDIPITQIGSDILQKATSEDISEIIENMGEIWKAVGGNSGLADIMKKGFTMPNGTKTQNFEQMIKIVQTNFVPGMNLSDMQDSQSQQQQKE